MKMPPATVVLRGSAFFALWFVLMPSAEPGDLTFGLVAAGLATWASVSLLPPAAGHMRPGALLAYLPRFLWKSVQAGFDIARRALDPRLPLEPGFVTCPTQLPPGRARNEFASIASLMPGSVAADDGPGAIVFHCLDVTQPVAGQMAEEERALIRVLVAGEQHA